MELPIRVLTLLVMITSTIVHGAQEPDFAGVWQGQIAIPGTPLDVAVTLEDGVGGWSGAIDIPAQGASGLPLEAVTAEGDAVAFTIADLPGTPTFTGTIDDDTMTGSFAQSGQEFPFTLQRADAGSAAAAEAAPEAGPAAPSEAEAEGEYRDPQGRFTFPVPAGWQVTEEDGFVTARDPSGGIRAHVVVTESDDPEEAVADAWARAVPEFDLEPDETLEPPSEPGIERTLLVNYDSGDDERVYQALAQVHDGTVYTLLFDGNLADLQRRSAHLQIIASGLTLTALEDVDLSGAETLPVADVLSELESFIEEQLDSFGIPGAAIAIVEGREIVHADGFGTTEADGDEPITADTHMMIGSTGKTMTSLLIATLVDDGIVDWDTAVVEVLPEFAVADPELTQEITLRNLLCACTGVPRRDFELFFNADDLDAEAIVDQLRTFEFFTDFGEAFQYSNQLVATSGYAAAAANGAAYGDLFAGYVGSLEERVLEPIGLEHTTLSFEQVVERDRYAQPHQQSIASGAYEPIELAIEEFLLPIGPAGAHWSTARDMARYMVTLLNAGISPDGDRVVSEENLRVTWQPQVPISATESYGLGWIVGEFKGVPWLYHAGNTLGFTSEFVFIPEADVGIVVLTNAQAASGFNGSVARRLFELIYDIPSEAEATAAFVVEQTATSLGEVQERMQAAADPEEVEPYLGPYTNDALGEIVLEMDGEQLVLDAGEFRAEIRPMLNRSGEFDGYAAYGVPVTGLPLELVEDETGAPTVVFGQGAMRYTFERSD